MNLTTDALKSLIVLLLVIFAFNGIYAIVVYADSLDVVEPTAIVETPEDTPIVFITMEPTDIPTEAPTMVSEATEKPSTSVPTIMVPPTKEEPTEVIYIPPTKEKDRDPTPTAGWNEAPTGSVDRSTPGVTPYPTMPPEGTPWVAPTAKPTIYVTILPTYPPPTDKPTVEPTP